MSVKVKLAVGAVVLVAVAVMGFLWVVSHVDSYDQRWTDCMRSKGGGTLYFPSGTYDEASSRCAHEVGARTHQTGDPDSWRWP